MMVMTYLGVTLYGAPIKMWIFILQPFTYLNNLKTRSTQTGQPPIQVPVTKALPGKNIKNDRKYSFTKFIL